MPLLVKNAKLFDLLLCMLMLIPFLLIPRESKAQIERDAVLVYENAATSEISYFYFAVDSTKTLLIREGMSPGAPFVTLPPSIIRNIYTEWENSGNTAPEVVERLDISYEDQVFSLNVMRHINLLLAGILGAVILTLVSILWWFWTRLALERRKRAEALESSRRLSEGREVERKRIAQDLHDGPIQDLHAIRMRLAGKKNNNSAFTANAMEDHLVLVIRELRTLCDNLRPPALGPFGLAAALDSYIQRFQERSPKLKVTLEAMNDDQQLSENVRLALFRIVQEALNNTAQHARATLVSVRLALDNQMTKLEIMDNGRGFDHSENWISLAREGHYGLLGMSERADAIGARFQIQSAVDKGTSIRVLVPSHN